MTLTEEIRRRREREQFEAQFALGDAIVEFIKENNCSIKEAISFFRQEKNCTDRTLRAAERTARAFPSHERNPSVGFTKHQALAEVSRKNIHSKTPHSDTEWRLALREALVVIRQNSWKVNELNSSKSSSDGVTASKIVLSCLQKIKFS